LFPESLQLDRQLVKLVRELERHLVGVVRDDQFTRVLADVEGLVERERLPAG
jgi:hypothetical protein